MQRFLLAKRAWVVLLAAVCGAYLYGLGAVPLLGPDEPRYAQVAREMLARGDWVTPRLGGQNWFEKPALLYWLMAAAFRVLGETELAARLGSALAGLATILFVGWTARRAEFESGEGLRGFGITVAAVAGSTLGLIVFAHAASFDMLLTAAVAGSLACLYASEVTRDESRRRAALVGFYLFVGASLLAKGLVGFVLPGGVAFVYFLLRRRLSGIFRMGLLWGVPLALLVAATWYAPVWARHGRVFFEQFFVQHHFARFVSDRFHHPQPFYFYLPVTMILALPWTAFLIGGIWGAGSVNPRAEDAASKLRVLALAWLVMPVLFFSASGSKLPGYVLPAIPGAAILAGDCLYRYLSGRGGLFAMRLTGALALLFAAAGVALCFFNIRGEAGEIARELPKACAVALVTPAAFAGLVALLLTKRRALCAASVVGATLVTVIVVVTCALPTFARHDTVAQLLKEADARGLGDVRVVQLHTIDRTAEFYASGRLAYGADGEPVKLEGANEVADFAAANGGAALVIVPVEEEHQLSQEPRLTPERVGDNGSNALVLVRTR
ncbi:MAG TPA: glycosyltransferase family 39 protein [Pyrinomonadaceae bacterium]|nr:glycosyltransferase family 39 protein [Pyrinomonadaceae bacterium]